MPVVLPAPYVALGDSLTHGMQSGGIAWHSQNYSYPKLVADFLGARPFAQPMLKGWLPKQASQGQPGTWVGSPPNMELVLRRAELSVSGASGKPAPDPGSWRELHDEVEGVVAALREAITDYIRAVEDATPADLLVEAPPASGMYQNLGVFGFNVQDISTTSYVQATAGMRPSFRGQIARIARHVIEGAAPALAVGGNAHPSVLEALSLSLLTAVGNDFGARLNAERVGYVLGRGHRTALETARAQQPRIVTLWIGNNDVLSTMTNAHIWDGDRPLYTPADVFHDRMAALIDAILAFESRPCMFVATLPSPTASPNLQRSRLGHWKSMLPSAAFLLDGQLLELEAIVGQYNESIRQLAAERPGRVWVVDVHALQERMQRGTRSNAEATRRVVVHAVRAGHLTMRGAEAALGAARAGNLHTIRHALDIDAQLAGRSFTEIAALPPDRSGATLANEAFTARPGAPDVDAFVVRLASGETYRLTGEFLAAGDNGRILQGGSVSLDSMHLTNSGYAYVAREFLRVLYEADAHMRGTVLRGLPGQQKSLAQFDVELLRVAQQDSLLNDIPRLLPAVLDALGASADLLGQLHFSDPYLTR